MSVTAVMAELFVTDAERAVQFYTRLFRRPPDDTPMDKLFEWHFDGPGVQVFEDPDRAGRSGATIVVTDLDAEVAVLNDAGISHGPLIEATYVRLVQLADPDQNRIVLSGAK